eukprot:GHVU01226713.1.p3 GENE.GHVU01226713.1~~GHVU01226713.1.p3  ORF type:complete len:104 (-),score=14.88 GHVU01226713.1:22-333(-)
MGGRSGAAQAEINSTASATETERRGNDEAEAQRGHVGGPASETQRVRDTTDMSSYYRAWDKLATEVGVITLHVCTTSSCPFFFILRSVHRLTRTGKRRKMKPK